MELLDPRLALVSFGVAAVSSERVRKGLGRGLGYAAAGAMSVGEGVVHAGREIVDEAVDVAAHNGKAASPRARKKPAAAG